MNTRLVAIAVMLSAVVGRGQQALPPGTPPAGTALIAGRVLAADTGRPIRGAVLRLVSYDVMRAARSAVTDDQGRYEYRRAGGGGYQLEVAADAIWDWTTVRPGRPRLASLSICAQGSAWPQRILHCPERAPSKGPSSTNSVIRRRMSSSNSGEWSTPLESGD